jgi:hypothetical protein
VQRGARGLPGRRERQARASTIIVAANAQLLRRLKLREDVPAAILPAAGDAAAHPA